MIQESEGGENEDQWGGVKKKGRVIVWDGVSLVEKNAIRLGERESEEVSLGRAGDAPEFHIGKDLVLMKKVDKVFSRRRGVRQR